MISGRPRKTNVDVRIVVKGKPKKTFSSNTCSLHMIDHAWTVSGLNYGPAVRNMLLTPELQHGFEQRNVLLYKETAAELLPVALAVVYLCIVMACYFESRSFNWVVFTFFIRFFPVSRNSVYWNKSQTQGRNWFLGDPPPCSSLCVTILQVCFPCRCRQSRVLNKHTYKLQPLASVTFRFQAKERGLSNILQSRSKLYLLAYKCLKHM